MSAVAVTVLLVGATTSLAGGASAVATPATAPVTYTDAVGDAGSAPDITSVTISNTADGLVTFQIAIANQPSLAPGAFVFVDIDTDQNATTGSPTHGGADRVFYLGDQGGFGALGWNGAIYVRAPVASLVASYANGVATFTFNGPVIGVGTGFNFYVVTQPDGTGSSTSYDLVPEFGLTNYRMQSVPPPPPPPTLTLSVIDHSARKAKAGATWIVGIEVVRSDTNQDLGTEGAIRCKAIIGRRALLATVRTFASRTTNGQTVRTALCGWRMPTGDRGKTVIGTITAVYRGARASYTFRAKVRA